MHALEVVERQLRAQDKPNLIYFAGDSSLDNKFWFENRARATNGYEHILRPPESKLDVAYHVNKLLEARNPRWACVSTCVEIKILRRVRAESSRRPPRHRRDTCSICLLYTSPSPRDKRQSRMPSSA